MAQRHPPYRHHGRTWDHIAARHLRARESATIERETARDAAEAIAASARVRHLAPARQLAEVRMS